MTGLAVNFVSKVVRHRGLIRSMVQRDLKSRYVGSVMGIFWSVIHPLVLLVSYTFVFSVIPPNPSPPGSRIRDRQLRRLPVLRHSSLDDVSGDLDPLQQRGGR